MLKIWTTKFFLHVFSCNQKFSMLAYLEENILALRSWFPEKTLKVIMKRVRPPTKNFGSNRPRKRSKCIPANNISQLAAVMRCELWVFRLHNLFQNLNQVFLIKTVSDSIPSFQILRKVKSKESWKSRVTIFPRKEMTVNLKFNFWPIPSEWISLETTCCTTAV